MQWYTKADVPSIIMEKMLISILLGNERGMGKAGLCHIL